MKILVTGAAGFIESNLCEYFIGKGYDVLGLDNLATGHLLNTAPLEKLEFFTFIKNNKQSYNSTYEKDFTCFRNPTRSHKNGAIGSGISKTPSSF
jgi:nucleoside-diphosphate-sugar epimerase